LIAYIRLQRFKCFLDQTLQFAPLSILCGTNNAGKSTVIQSLLFLKQSALMGNFTKADLPLNGPLVHMGTARDLFCQWAEEDNIKISFAFFELPDCIFTFKIAYHREDPDALSLKLMENPANLPENSLFADRFFYLDAERMGPQLVYPVSEDSPEAMHVGFRGEYTAHCLHQFGNKKIKLPQLKHLPEDHSLELLFQVEEWLKDMLPGGIMINPVRITQADILQVSFRVSERNTGYLRPTSIGFGISYCLPIIVAGLMAEKDNLLIVENPEAHLHPKAQSRMGIFLSKLAAAGVQVILETHSDHLLNGIRIAVKKRFINEKDVSINFFEPDYSVVRPEIDADGRIDLWPDGFFDQAEKDLGELI